jgi:hypothetical protein
MMCLVDAAIIDEGGKWGKEQILLKGLGWGATTNDDDDRSGGVS